VESSKSRELAMTEQRRTENLVTNELSLDELNSVTGGTDKTPPKPKNPKPPANPGHFEVEDYSFDIEQTLGIGSQ
jgi:hypothetical protein